jgi:hypothetical protein
MASDPNHTSPFDTPFEIHRRSFLKIVVFGLLGVLPLSHELLNASPVQAGNCTSVRCEYDHTYTCDGHGCVTRYDVEYCYDYFDNHFCWGRIRGNCQQTSIWC